MLIDNVYKTLLTIINKEQQGYITPTEFNLIAGNVQNEIYRTYFEDENKDRAKRLRGLTGRGHTNLGFNERQRTQQFAATSELVVTTGVATLPTNVYFIEDNGVTTASDQTYTNKLVEEVDRGSIVFLENSMAKPTDLYPIYERYEDTIVVSPQTVTKVAVRYLRTPLQPNWTYFTLTSGDPVFNPSNNSFQDFELHDSEFSNVVVRMLSYFGITIREEKVVQIAEMLKDKNNIKENS